MARRVLLIVHIAVVVLLMVLLAVMVAADGDGPDANIGAGLVLLPLIALGLPWSLIFFFDPYSFDDAPTVVFVLVSIAPAVLNIVLHWAIGRWLRRRPAPV
jgi:hypothetical protein